MDAQWRINSGPRLDALHYVPNHQSPTSPAHRGQHHRIHYDWGAGKKRTPSYRVDGRSPVIGMHANNRHFGRLRRLLLMRLSLLRISADISIYMRIKIRITRLNLFRTNGDMRKRKIGVKTKWTKILSWLLPGNYQFTKGKLQISHTSGKDWFGGCKGGGLPESRSDTEM